MPKLGMPGMWRSSAPERFSARSLAMLCIVDCAKDAIHWNITSGLEKVPLKTLQ